jgi:hypothetical protein
MLPAMKTDPNCYAFHSEDSYPVGQLIAAIRRLTNRLDLPAETAANHFAESFAKCASDVCREVVIEDSSDEPFNAWELPKDKSRFLVFGDGIVGNQAAESFGKPPQTQPAHQPRPFQPLAEVGLEILGCRARAVLVVDK